MANPWNIAIAIILCSILASKAQREQSIDQRKQADNDALDLVLQSPWDSTLSPGGGTYLDRAALVFLAAGIDYGPGSKHRKMGTFRLVAESLDPEIHLQQARQVVHPTLADSTPDQTWAFAVKMSMWLGPDAER